MLREVEPLGLCRQVAQAFAERRSLGIEIDKDQVEPFFGPHRGKTKLPGSKSYAVELGGDEQRAVEPVSPTVIAAAKQLAVAASGGGGPARWRQTL